MVSGNIEIDMEPNETRAFVCPACGGQMSVSPATQDAVIRNGCPFCAETVETGEAFGLS